MFYCLDEDNNKVEAYDKEGVLALLEEAIENGSLAGIVSDSAFVDKLKCCVTGTTNYVAFVTQAKYNELSANSQLKSNTIYYITDDTTCEDLDEHLDSINNEISAINSNIIRINDKINTINEHFRNELVDKSVEKYITKCGLYAITIPYGTYGDLTCMLTIEDLQRDCRSTCFYQKTTDMVITVFYNHATRDFTVDGVDTSNYPFSARLLIEY